MSHIQVDPAFMAIEKQLRDMDRQRDHLRAQLADAAMRADLAHVDLEFWMSAERRAEKKALLEERITKRAKRRALEMDRFGSYTRPGSWDADLDNYQEPQYEETVGDYVIRLKRARDLTYNAYVVLPEGHPAIGKSYDEVNEARPPVSLSYAERNTYGFYFGNTVKPRGDYETYDQHNFYSAEQTGNIPAIGSNYLGYHEMKEWCLKLVDFFTGWSVPTITTWTCSDCGVQDQPDHLTACQFCEMPRSRRAASLGLL
jgi:hypothetical protein